MSSAPPDLTLDRRHALAADSFVAAPADIFDHSIRVALAEMTAAVRDATRERQMAHLRGPPEPGGKAARSGRLTDASSTEQDGLGLDPLSDQAFDRFERRKARFGLFAVDHLPHYDTNPSRVPLLASPWSSTTNRGS